jgi:hypothetical protein
LLWQAESGFRFRLADGGLNDNPPHGLIDRAVMLQLIDNNVPPGGARRVIGTARADRTGAILVVNPGAAQWTSLLGAELRGRRLGGVALYPLNAAPGSCPPS